jgi:hypothetical protein
MVEEEVVVVVEVEEGKEDQVDPLPPGQKKRRMPS